MTKFFGQVVIGAFSNIAVKEININGLDSRDLIYIYTTIKPVKGGGFRREHILSVDSASAEKCKLGAKAHLDCIPKDNKQPQLHKVTFSIKKVEC